MEIVLIDIGVFQPYILDNIRNLKLFGNDTITVITDKHLVDNFKNVNVSIVLTSDIDDNEFDKKNKLSTGFWANCSKRLFLLYNYMKKYNKTNCIHIENDYLIYFKANEVQFGNSMWLTMDSPDRCIPGIIFVPDFMSLLQLTVSYDFGQNDMVNMARFYKRGTSKNLPILHEHVLFENHFDTFQMIFDAAAIGQYLGGIDMIHTNGGVPGFVNETCVVDYSKYTFHWVKEDTNFVPMLKTNEIFYKIAGLHIHSKRLHNFQGDLPIEKNLITFL